MPKISPSSKYNIFWKYISGKRLTNIRKIIDVFKKDIKTIINKLKIVVENIEKLYGIYSEMITEFDDKKRNYEYFMSLNNIKTDMVFQQIQGINQINDLNNKIPQILGLYDNMNMNHQLLDQNQLMFNQMPANTPNTNANDNNFNKTNFPSCKTPQQINQYSPFGTTNNSMNQLGMQQQMMNPQQMGLNPQF